MKSDIKYAKEIDKKNTEIRHLQIFLKGLYKKRK